MKIHAGRNAIARDLEAGGGPEGRLKGSKIGEALLRRRISAQQRAKRAAVHGAIRGLIRDLEDQGIDVGTPARSVVQASPRWSSLSFPVC